MLKNRVSFLIIMALAVIFQACNNFKKTDSGLEYKVVTDTAGTNAKYGDVVVCHMKFRNEVDSLDTYKTGPVNIMVDSIHKGSLEEGLTHISKGDSITLIVVNDSLYRKNLPKNLKPEGKTTLNIKVLDVLTPERMKKEMAERSKQKVKGAILYMKDMKKMIIDSSATQLKQDSVKIEKYVSKNKLNGGKTESGVYYVVTQEGAGAKPQPGDTVTVNYVGKTIDGKEFDNSAKHGRPLVFQSGIGQMILGFDEAVSYIKEGSKATIIIPSPLAYGKDGIKEPNGKVVIAPNAILIFDIEVVKVAPMK